MNSEKIKLLIATQFPIDPEYPYGGVEAVSVNLVRSLSEITNLEIDVVTLNREVSEIKIEHWHNVNLHRLPRAANNELVNALGQGKKQLSDYIDKLSPDIIHAHDTYGIMVSDLDYPRVFTVHGFIYGDTLLSNKKLPWIRSKLWQHFEQQGWAKQPHIISISPYVRERVSQVSSAVIHDIDNPISESFFDIKQSGEKDIIFSAAVISPRKNTLNLVLATEKLVREGFDVELRLAGSSSNQEYSDLVERTIIENNLEENIKLLGRINSSEIKQELSKASIFALVSLEENSPMGIEEAMAAGIPVVTSNMCGMPYMVSDGESGYLVDPHDIEDIARRFRAILTNEKLRKKMKERSIQIARDRFHPQVVADKTFNVYRDILELS